MYSSFNIQYDTQRIINSRSITNVTNRKVCILTIVLELNLFGLMIRALDTNIQPVLIFYQLSAVMKYRLIFHFQSDCYLGNIKITINVCLNYRYYIFESKLVQLLCFLNKTAQPKITKFDMGMIEYPECNIGLLFSHKSTLKGPKFV